MLSFCSFLEMRHFTLYLEVFILTTMKRNKNNRNYKLIFKRV